MILSAHQPNFMPWSSYFEKLFRSDIFISLDHAQFVKGNFHNRFMYQDRWYTMSVKSGLRPISECTYANPLHDWAALKRKLPDFAEVFRSFDDIICDSVADTNFGIIERSLSLSSRSKPVVERETRSTLRATDRIVKLCNEYGADAYLSGPSGKRYLEVAKFLENGIRLEFFNDESPKKSLIESIADGTL